MADNNYSIQNNFFTSENIFLYWNTDYSGNGDTYYPNDNINIASNLKLYAIWKSRMPIPGQPYSNDFAIFGTGIPKSTIKVTFPSGNIVTNIVEEDGYWYILVPVGDELKGNQTITYTQIEPDMKESDPVIRTVYQRVE